MKSQRGGDIEIAIDVMYRVKSPQRRRDVIEPVPPPQAVIEKEDTRHEPNGFRQARAIEQAESPACGVAKSAIDQRFLQRGGDRRRDRRHREVASDSARIGIDEQTQRTAALSDGDRDKGAS